MNLKDLQLKIETMQGGLLAHTAMLNALISAHPAKEDLLRCWTQHRERAHAVVLGEWASETPVLGFVHVADQLEQQVRLSMGT